MMVSKRNLLLLSAVVAAAVGAHFVTVAIGQPAGPAGPGPEAGRDGAGMLVRWLGLEGEAASVVRTESEAFRRDMRQLQRQLQIEQLELANLFESDEATEAQLREQFETLGRAHMAIHSRIAENVLAIRPHLDSDQRAKFQDFVARHFRGEQAGPGAPSGRGGPSGPGGPGGPAQQGPPRMHDDPLPGGRRPPPPGGQMPDGAEPPPDSDARTVAPTD